MSTIKNSSALPSAMEKKLKSIRLRQSLLAAMRAAAIGASVLIAAMVVAMIADWSFTLFNTGLRTTLTVGSFALAVVALLATGVSPLIAAFRRTRAATNADAEVPQLEERWTTVATFAASNHQPTTATEKAMLQQVTSEAVAMGRLVQPARVARPKALRPAGLALGACGLVLAGFLAINWPQTSVLLQRFWSPTTDITATQLKSTTGDIVIPRGESLDLVTEVSGLPRDTAILEMETGSELFDVFELTPDEDNPLAFVHSLSVDQSFRYRVRSGDGQTPWHTVTAIDYPAIEKVWLTVTAPDYVDRPPYEKTLIPSRVRVIQGSRLKLLMKPVDSLERLELALTFDAENAEKEPSQRLLTLTPDADGRYRFETQLLGDMSLSPTLFGSHGLTNEDKRVCRIQVIPDKVPVARIVSPSNEMAVAVDDVIDVKLEAHDDHGIATAELVVYDESATEEGGEPKILSVQPIPLDDQRLKKHVMATVQLDLKKLNLEEGTNISYAIRVTDNRNVQFDPKAMQAQMAETRPGESPLDDLENMLADARDPSGNQPSQSRDETQTDTGTEEGKAGLPTGDATTTSEPADDTDKSKQDEGEGKGEGKANSNGKTPNGKPTGEAPNGKTTVAADENKPDAGEGENEERKAKGKSTPGENENIAGEPKNDSGGDKPGRDAKSETPDRDTKDAKQTLAQADSRTDDNQRENDSKQSNGSASENQGKETENGNKSSRNGLPRDKIVAMNPQQAESGQNAETTRRTLKITARLTAVAAASGRNADKMQIRDRVVRIDEMLAGVETALTKVVERNIPDADRSEQFRILDTQLGDIGAYVAELRNETKGRQFAFVGLQMVHISRTQVAPARNRIFIAIREPLGTDNPTNALHYVVRAREMLATLLKRYDRVAQDQELAKALDETVKMYEVYVEKMQQLMRERRQNRNPLQRKMEVVEVDQNYLDRYAEVLTLRREMMAEFGRMFGDDPRLLARYLDLVRRRRNSLRDQLSEVFERQDEISTELSGWLQVGKNQRDDLWTIIAEMRIHATTPLAKDAALLAERVEQAMPLVLKEDQGTAALVIAHARQIVRISRSITFDAKKFGQTDGSLDLVTNAERLVLQFSELDAALEQLNFEHEGDEDVSTYVDSRLLESRTVADQADEWSQIASHLEQKRYFGLAEVDQQKVAIVTELLRVEMLGMEDDLQNQFQRQVDFDLPGEIVDMIRELHRVMESITFNQAAATFAMTKNRLPIAELQEAKTMQGFQRAEKLFDLIRRATIAALDEYDPPDPNIADLRDPTLDEFLERLEREPNIEALLGIPRRPRNLRVIADSMQWQQTGGDLLGDSSEAARQRGKKAQRMIDGKGKPEKPETEMTDEERKQREKAGEMQETLEKSLASIKAKLDDPKTSREQRRKLEQMAKNMKRMLDQMGERNPDDEEWKRIVESDKAKEALRALANGKGIPDEQWNKLLSTLDDGLWQVRGRTLPEEYRKSIEQYQERIRQLLNTAGSGTE